PLLGQSATAARLETPSRVRQRTRSDRRVVPALLPRASRRSPGACMMYTTIQACRGCGHDTLHEILAFGDMPLSNGLLSEAQLSEPEPKIPLTVVFCPACSLVQIRETVAPEVLFNATYPYFSSVSDALVAHCRDNALELIETRHVGPGRSHG